MLLNLRIRDFAIIHEVELDFLPGYTVVTGETGAGKSILVGALNLVLGGRASTDLIRAGADQAQVEALFDISQHPLVRARLEQRDLVGDDLNTLLVRRVVGRKGRGKVTLNGNLATVATLGEIVRGLVDISGQHEQQSLLHVESHLDILDAYGQADGLREEYRQGYEGLRALMSERETLQRGEEQNLARADYLRFQLEEIERLNPQPGEEEELATERRRLGSAEKLKTGAALAEGLIYGDDGSAFDKLGKASAEVEALLRIDDTLAPVADALASARRELEEAARELQHYSERIEADPGRLEDVENRLAELSRLTRKHGGGIAEVLAKAAELTDELNALDNSDERLRALAHEITAQAQATQALAHKLSALRSQAAKKLAKAVKAELEEMDLAGAVFVPQVSPRSGAEGLEVEGGLLGPSGQDDVEFLWSANKGEPPKALAKIASGGELSRLMLAVKTVLCNRDLVSLYVFDEVDTGLGGRAADCIGRKIQAVAQGHQAITITHLAPIAARADHHLRVAKKTVGNRTISTFERVTGEARADEIARMIDGAEITKVTLEAAREMLHRSR